MGKPLASRDVGGSGWVNSLSGPEIEVNSQLTLKEDLHVGNLRGSLRRSITESRRETGKRKAAIFSGMPTF